MSGMMRRNIMGANKFKNIVKKAEDMLAATSFAEAGESGIARSILAEGRRVLLALKAGRVDIKTLKYAVNTAKRISAGLDILYVAASGRGADAEDPMIKELEADLASTGIGYRLIRRTGCLKEAVIDYTNREKDILFAVVESPHALDADCRSKDNRLAELWRQLKCPLVVVMDGARA